MTSATRREPVPGHAPAVHRPARTPDGDAPQTGQAAVSSHPRRAVARLYARLIRRSTALMAVALAGFCALEIASYGSAYPDGISPVQFAMFEDNPAIRMINGTPYALESAAGFTLWDAGWMWQLILAVWAILTVTRFLRGDEDLDRADLLLAGPVRAPHVTAVVLAIVVGAGLLISACVAGTMVALGQDAQSSVLLGLSLAGATATFAAVAAVAGQLVEVRRRAAGLAGAVLGLAWVVRMIGDSTDSRGWLRWFSPLAWMEVLQLYGDPRVVALVPAIVVPVALGVAAVALRARRDTGSALLVSESAREPRLRQLGSSAAFAWRSNRAVLLAWGVGISACATVMGGILGSMLTWLAGDEGYQRILANMGLDQAITYDGFLAFMAMVLGLAVALQVAWRFGATRAEEEAGRLEQVLARPVTRSRWLIGHALLTLAGGVLLILVGGASLWVGATVAGSGDITWGDAMASTLNLLPVVVLTCGLSVFAFGLLPRLTVALPVSLTVVGFVLSMLGPALDWPQWALDLSPFTHLAPVPAEAWAAASGLGMAAIGVALAVAGLVSFNRRDLTCA